MLIKVYLSLLCTLPCVQILLQQKTNKQRINLCSPVVLCGYCFVSFLSCCVPGKPMDKIIEHQNTSTLTTILAQIFILSSHYRFETEILSLFPSHTKSSTEKWLIAITLSNIYTPLLMKNP